MMMRNITCCFEGAKTAYGIQQAQENTPDLHSISLNDPYSRREMGITDYRIFGKKMHRMGIFQSIGYFYLSIR